MTEIEKLKKENEILKSRLDIIANIDRESKYKQILADIKEIAENVQSFVDINLEDDVYTEMNKILQKISECEVENE